MVSPKMRSELKSTDVVILGESISDKALGEFFLRSASQMPGVLPGASGLIDSGGLRTWDSSIRIEVPGFTECLFD